MKTNLQLTAVCCKWAEGINISFCAAIISSSCLKEFLSANEQIINFFILYSAGGFGQKEHLNSHLHHSPAGKRLP